MTPQPDPTRNPVEAAADAMYACLQKITPGKWPRWNTLSDREKQPFLEMALTGHRAWAKQEEICAAGAVALSDT